MRNHTGVLAARCARLLESPEDCWGQELVWTWGQRSKGILFQEALHHERTETRMLTYLSSKTVFQVVKRALKNQWEILT